MSAPFVRSHAGRQNTPRSFHLGLCFTMLFQHTVPADVVWDNLLHTVQAAEYWQMAFLSLLSMVQSTVVWIGMAAGLVVCVWGVAKGELTVGDTVLFVTMMQQLYVPLTFFGSYYRQVSSPCVCSHTRLISTVSRVRLTAHRLTCTCKLSLNRFRQENGGKWVGGTGVYTGRG
jgi:ABC-type multidrug transport system fused ATPase/permease subunit